MGLLTNVFATRRHIAFSGIYLEKRMDWVTVFVNIVGSLVSTSSLLYLLTGEAVTYIMSWLVHPPTLGKCIETFSLNLNDILTTSITLLMRFPLHIHLVNSAMLVGRISFKHATTKALGLYLVTVGRVWRYQRGNQNHPYIEEQTKQWPKEQIQKI